MEHPEPRISWLRRSRPALISCLFVLALAGVAVAQPDDFDDELARVDKALMENPKRVGKRALDSCLQRRNAAVKLADQGHTVRAMRRLKRCRLLLLMSDAPKPAKTGPTEEEKRAGATRELEQALALAPNLENGLVIYRECAACHTAEGWGLANGLVPQIAGQHKQVVIKQLTDIRAGIRDAHLMLPYATGKGMGGAQDVADVAAYVDTLEINPRLSKGPGSDLELGKKLYVGSCQSCHGAQAEGDGERFVPRLQAQPYRYLVRQFERIRDGQRKNAHAGMVAQIQEFGEAETQAVLDYVSRLEPPEELTAPEGWKNPDFVE